MKTGRYVAGGVLVVGVVAGLCYGAYRYGRGENPSYGPTVMNLEKMGHLVSLRTNMSKVLVLDWSWWPTQKLLYVANGDVLLVSDIRGAKVLQKDEASRTAKIMLPRIETLSPRLDQKQSFVYDASTLITPAKRDWMARKAAEEAQDCFEKAAACSENIATAKANVRQVMTKFWELVGWQVEVVFADDQEAGKP